MKPLLFLLLASMLLPAQERVLLHIGPNGQQEAIPLKKGETARAVIERREQQRAALYRAERSAGLKDTLKYYGTDAELTTNFGWTHQDVAMQWYQSQAKGTVKEFWWLNYLNRGVLNKGTVRAWHINPKLATLPALPTTNFIGSYKDAADGDGGVQPFQPATGNQWFYGNGAADSMIYSFDPFTKEAKWLAGGLQVNLDSNSWQGVKLDDWGDSMNVQLGELFGFTLSNDTKKADVGAGTDTRMEILSVASAGAPYHSYKFYETGRTAPTNAGWHLRGDYEWGMYVVIEYTSVPPRHFIVGAYGTTLQPGPRSISVFLTDDNPSGGPSGVSHVRLFSKIGLNAKYDSTTMTNSGSTYTGYTVSATNGDTVYWYIAATSVSGERATTPVRSYTVFKKNASRIFVYNNAGFSRSNAHLIYTGSSNGGGSYDYWSAPSDGTGDIPALLNLYSDILVVDGSFPSRNVYTALKQRLASATPASPVSVFFTSQDYGCYITSACQDTAMAAGTLEYDYFGVSQIGTQDVSPTNREFRVIPQADTVTNYLIKFGADSNSTLWCDPTFELGFASYQDNIVPRSGAKAVLKDADSHTWAVKYITPATRAMYASIDVGALSFRSDTALAPGNDPKYRWLPTQVGALPNAFFNAHRVTSVPEAGENVPDQFSLGQNFPNPFNPSTTIEYSIPAATHVTVTIYNAIGQRIAVLVNGPKAAGLYQVQWNAANSPSGLYFYEMRAGAFTSVKKMLLLK